MSDTNNVEGSKVVVVTYKAPGKQDDVQVYPTREGAETINSSLMDGEVVELSDALDAN